jgi:predicted O-methyltransferase YrrM
MEELGLLRKGTVVVADNVVYPGAPGYLEYVDTANGRYTTELLPAAFEYEQKWKSDWDGPKADALSVSIYNGRD